MDLHDHLETMNFLSIFSSLYEILSVCALHFDSLSQSTVRLSPMSICMEKKLQRSRQ